MSNAKNWCYTLNNYASSDLSSLVKIESLYHVFGKEVGESGTPHLQGYIMFTTRKKLPQVKKLIPRANFSVLRSNPKAASDYCKKDGDFTESGEIPKSTQGARNDIHLFMDDVKAGSTDSASLIEKHPSVFARFPRFVHQYLDLHRPLPPVPLHPLRPWQATLKERLTAPPDSRSIHFVVDLVGNSGKSWFADWYVRCNLNTSQVLTPAKFSDMAYALKDDLTVLFLDAPRSKQGDYIQYDFLEALKNGRIFCPKYESRMRYFPPMHVIVLMNEFPDMTKLSEDRYVIMETNS